MSDICDLVRRLATANQRIALAIKALALKHKGGDRQVLLSDRLSDRSHFRKPFSPQGFRRTRMKKGRLRSSRKGLESGG